MDDLTEKEIEDSVQHDLAILREHFAEIGGPNEDDDIATLRDRVAGIQQHIAVNNKIAG